MILVAAMLLAGTVAGVMLNRDMTGDGPSVGSDSLAWLADRPAGSAVEINPSNGRPENRVVVADAGEGFELAQRDGLLVVTSPDGRVSVIDIATLAALGGYAGHAGTLALLDEENLFAVDLAAGSIVRLDPGTAATLTTWRGGDALVDAVLDGQGTIWALGADGRLHHLLSTGGGIDEAGPPTRIPGAGPLAVLTAHPAGVTVLAPGTGPVVGAGTGIAVRVGTPDDTTITVPGLTGRVIVPPQASFDLVPVSVTDASSVLLIARDATVAVDTRPYGCDRPAESAEHNRLAYFSCQGAGLVIALDQQGHHAPPDIHLPPGTDADITVHDGRFFAYADGSGAIIDREGLRTDLNGAAIGPVPASTTTPPPPATTRRNNPPGGGGTGGGGQQPVTPPTTTPPPPTPANGDPVVAGVSAVQQSYVSDGCYNIPNPPPPIPDCTTATWYEYTASLNPPPAWSSFGGTCRLQARQGATLVVDISVECSATSAFVGTGTGATWDITVQACAATCANSAPYAVATLPPQTCTVFGCT